MNIKTLLKELKRSTNFDESLATSVILTLLAKKHLLCVAETRDIVNVLTMLNIHYTETALDEESSNADELFEDGSQDSSSSGSHVYILEGLESTSKTFQNRMAKLLGSRDPKFCVISPVSSKLAMSSYIKSKFWFTQERTMVTLPLTSNGLNIEPFIEEERERLLAVTMIPEVKRYTLDIIIFVRNHRVVTGGIPTKIVSELDTLSRCMALLHGYTFVTPSMVKLAARKLLPMHIEICKTENEPTLMWGSDPKLVNEMMKHWTPLLVVEDCLVKIVPPS